MLEDNSDRFAFSMEDIHPASFTGEAIRPQLRQAHLQTTTQMRPGSVGLRGGAMQEFGSRGLYPTVYAIHVRLGNNGRAEER